MNFLDLIFPKDLYCISCGRPLPLQEKNSLALCGRCADEIVWVTGRCCNKCGRPLSHENPTGLCHDCAKSEHVFRKGYACAMYAGFAAELIRDIKYREKAWYTDTLAALMADRYFAEADPDTGELPCYDLIVSVPMTAKKKASRGYDQATLLARGLARRIGVPYLSKALSRIRETGVMSSLSADERRQNLVCAFTVNYDIMKMIANKRILLTDDVYTTGSSVNACAETLLAAGVESVDVMVFAIGADVSRSEQRGSEATKRRAEDRPAVVESPSQLRAKGPT